MRAPGREVGAGDATSTKLGAASKAAYPSRALTATTFATLLLSLPLIATGLWLAVPRHRQTCFRFLEYPIIVVGACLLLLSVVGMVGARICDKLLLWVYMVGVFVLILLLSAVLIFALFVTRGGPSYPVSRAVFKEYRLGGYSLWFQGQVRDPSKWGEMTYCLKKEVHVCADLDHRYRSRTSFFQANLTPPQSGCCKPPTACGATFVHATKWVNMTHGLATSDCGRWENGAQYLCYNCGSCKAGLLENVKHLWRLIAIIGMVNLACLIIFYTLGWLAFLKGLWDGVFTYTIRLPAFKCLKDAHGGLLYI